MSEKFLRCSHVRRVGGNDVQTNFANGVYIWIKSAPSGVGGERSDSWGFGRVVCSASKFDGQRLIESRLVDSSSVGKLTSAEF